MMTSNEIRQRFLDFFAKRRHAILPSAPLIPQADGADRNITLFNVAGMQPLMPYLLGEDHPQGKLLASSQKCLRTVDIDEVGDNTHATFFEMLGNWSLGDYYKKEAIQLSYKFLTNTEEGLDLDANRLYVTVFAGNDRVERDEEAADIWRGIFNTAGLDPEKRIFYLPSKSNWWTAGPNSPAGPSTEMFYDLTGELTKGLTHDEFMQADNEQKVVEIWNNVFMAYRQEGGEVVAELPNKNVDTGSGLERLTAVVQEKRSIFETDLFMPIISTLLKFTHLSREAINEKEFMNDIRIISDHLKSVSFLISEGINPNSTGRGYVLRNLIRRAMTSYSYIANNLEEINRAFGQCVDSIIKIYSFDEGSEVYSLDGDIIKSVLAKEINSFLPTLRDSNAKIAKDLKEMKKTPSQVRSVTRGVASIIDNPVISTQEMFYLHTTKGHPVRSLISYIKRNSYMFFDEEGFSQKMQEHKKLSQSASAGMFKGGLANTNEKTVQLHTAHHLLLAALQQVLGLEVKQRGSNITEERLRIDFVFDRKMTDEEKAQVENIVNEKIQAKIPVLRKEMKREEAEVLGAEMEFGQKYPDIVSVYVIGDEGNYFSKEFCGGPHVENTGELGHFKIQKEEASSSGIRRIKAILV